MLVGAAARGGRRGSSLAAARGGRAAAAARAAAACSTGSPDGQGAGLRHARRRSGATRRCASRSTRSPGAGRRRRATAPRWSARRSRRACAGRRSAPTEVRRNGAVEGHADGALPPAGRPLRVRPNALLRADFLRVKHGCDFAPPSEACVGCSAVSEPISLGGTLSRVRWLALLSCCSGLFALTVAACGSSDDTIQQQRRRRGDLGQHPDDLLEPAAPGNVEGAVRGRHQRREARARSRPASKVGKYKIKYVSLDDSTAQNPGTADEGQTAQNARKAVHGQDHDLLPRRVQLGRHEGLAADPQQGEHPADLARRTPTSA